MSTAVEDEIASMTANAKTLASIPVVLPDDHVPNPDEVELPRKMTAFPVDLPPPPAVTSTSPSSGGAETVNLVVKSLKPVISFPLTVSPTDSILSIKEQLSNSHSRAPTPDVQRLLLKGKVLADGKLLKEYFDTGGLTEGTVLSLMIKPGASWSAEEKPKPAMSIPIPPASDALATPGKSRTSHSRSPSEGGAADQYPVPALMLSTPMSPTSEDKPRKPVPLEIADPQMLARASVPGSRPGSPSLGHGVIKNPEFWRRLREFLGSEFDAAGARGTDADELFEEFLRASKGSLEATDVARIRDAVNISGMGGT